LWFKETRCAFGNGESKTGKNNIKNKRKRYIGRYPILLTYIQRIWPTHRPIPGDPLFRGRQAQLPSPRNPKPSLSKDEPQQQVRCGAKEPDGAKASDGPEDEGQVRIVRFLFVGVVGCDPVEECLGRHNDDEKGVRKHPGKHEPRPKELVVVLLLGSGIAVTLLLLLGYSQVAQKLIVSGVDIGALGGHFDVATTIKHHEPFLSLAGEIGINHFEDANVSSFLGGPRLRLPNINQNLLPFAQEIK